MVLVAVVGVLPLPAAATVVLEAVKVATKVRPHHTLTDSAQGILKVGVNLDLHEIDKHQ